MTEFAILYRWQVEPEYQDYFIERWRAGTIELRSKYGALGSCLSRADDGAFIAFARWPSEEARARAFAARGPLEPWPGILSFTETRLTVEQDLLTRETAEERNPR